QPPVDLPPAFGAVCDRHHRSLLAARFALPRAEPFRLLATRGEGRPDTPPDPARVEKVAQVGHGGLAAGGVSGLLVCRQQRVAPKCGTLARTIESPGERAKACPLRACRPEI